MSLSFPRKFGRQLARPLLGHPILFALFLGLAVWAADAWLETRFSPGVSFVGALYTRVSPHHLSLRLVVLAALLMAGEVLSLLGRMEQAKERYQRLINLGNDGIVVIQDGILKFVNQRFGDLVGTPPRECLERRFDDFVFPGHRVQLSSLAKKSGTGEELSLQFEVKLAAPDGGEVPAEVSASSISYGVRPACLAIIRDVSARKRVYDALRESEKKYSTLVERSNDGIIIIQDGKIKFSNRRMLQATGNTLEEALGKPFLDYVAPAFRDRVRERYARRMAGKSVPDNYEIAILSSDNREIPVEINASMIKYMDRPADMAIVRDISARKKTEEALRESEMRFRTLYEISPSAILVEDGEGNIISVNNQFCKLYGYSRQEMMGLKAWDIIPDELRGGYDSFFKHIQQEKQISIESLCRKKNGEIFISELNAGAVRINDRDCIQLMIRDITESKRALDELKRSRARLEKIINSSADGILIVDQRGIIRFANKAAETLYGRVREELIGSSIQTPLTVGDTLEIEIDRRGKKITAEMKVVETEWEGQESFLVSMRDMTERKQLDQIKDEFVDTVSHELRNPLATMKSGLGLMLRRNRDRLDEIGKEVISTVLEETDRLTRLVNNLLDLSKMEAGKVVLDRSVVDIGDLISAAVNGFRKLAEDNRVVMRVDLPPGKLPVYADRDRLTEILDNLLSNALKYTPPGGRVELSAGNDGGYLEVRVSDTGVGISPEDQEQLFDKFKQFALPPSGGAAGSGLGLAITKKLVEMHGGDIRVASTPGHGSLFSFKIPDHLSDSTLADYLDGLIVREAAKAVPPCLLGVRLGDLRFLEGWEAPGIRRLFEQFARQITGQLDRAALTNFEVWLLEKNWEYAAIFERMEIRELESIFQNFLGGLRKFRLLKDGRPFQVKISAGCLAVGPEPADGTDVLARFREHLSQAPSVTVPSETRARILLADDDEGLQNLLRKVFAEEGMDMIGARDGEEALRLAGESAPDLIILDIILPRLTGYQVLNRLKSDRRTSSIPVLVISGEPLDQVRLKNSASGIIPVVLEKPFEIDYLLKVIYRNLKIVTINA